MPHYFISLYSNLAFSEILIRDLRGNTRESRPQILLLKEFEDCRPSSRRVLFKYYIVYRVQFSSSIHLEQRRVVTYAPIPGNGEGCMTESLSQKFGGGQYRHCPSNKSGKELRRGTLSPMLNINWRSCMSRDRHYSVIIE